MNDLDDGAVSLFFSRFIASADAINLYRLQNDPLVHVVRAKQANLKFYRAIIAANISMITEHRQHIDRDFDVLRHSRDDLTAISRSIVTSAKAEVEAVHAETAHRVVASIARSAEQKRSQIQLNRPESRRHTAKTGRLHPKLFYNLFKIR